MSAVTKTDLAVLQELVPNTIARKILQVSQEVGHIEKNGLNQHFKFKYQSWEDVLPAVRQACVKVGLTVIPSFDLIGEPTDRIFVKATFTIMDADDPTATPLVFNWVGESLGKDDKGVQKAITSATKYAYLKLFMIPCADTVDPDAEAPKKRTQVAKQATPAPSAEKAIAAECGDWWKSIGGTKEGWGQLPKSDRVLLVLEAKDAGCKTPDDVSKYLHDGEVPFEI